MMMPFILAASALAQDTATGVWTLEIGRTNVDAVQWAALEAKGLTSLKVVVLPDAVPALAVDPPPGALPVSDHGGNVVFDTTFGAKVNGTFANSKFTGTLSFAGAEYTWTGTLSSSLWVCGGKTHDPHHVVPTELVETYTREKGCSNWRKLRGPEDVPQAPPAVVPAPAAPGPILPP